MLSYLKKIWSYIRTVFFTLMWIGVLTGVISVGYTTVMNFTTASTLMLNPVVDRNIVQAGDVIHVTYQIIRFKSCSLNINRLLISEDNSPAYPNREYLLQSVVQDVEGDGVLRPSGYDITIPSAIATGNYKLMSRVRYYCNAIDYVIPRFYTPKTINIKVDNPRVPQK